MKLKISSLMGLSLVLPFFLGNADMSAQTLPKRDQVEERFKWDLSPIYKSDNDMEKDFALLVKKADEFKKFKGKIGASAKEFADAITFYYDAEKVLMRLYFYSSMNKDLDLNDGKRSQLFQRTNKAASDFSAATSYFMPELMSYPQDKIMGFIKQDSRLKAYEYKIKEMFRQKAHTLSEGEEKLLAQLSESQAIPEETYSILNDADLPFPSIKDEKGNDVKLSHGRYRAGLFSDDRAYRERVYKGTYVPYQQLINTMATLYNGRVKQRLANAKIRNYETARESYLSNDDIPVAVYDNLVKTCRDNIKTQHRWASIKKKVLKLSELHPYDTYASLFPGSQKKYTFDEARNLSIEALKPLGEEYTKTLQMAFDNRWIDVFETEGKRSGAYSNGCGCGVHPYILLNWNGTLDDVFTLVHELGHTMHSYFTEKSQPYHYANYSTFVAEVASTMNEALLLDYLLKKATTKEEKAALLEKFMINAQQTFFRQTQFADFEATAHAKAEKGEYMTADELTKLFADQYQFYWGPEMVTDYEEGLSWARIPHLFHYNFYVFQYATSFAASQALSQAIIEQGKPAIDKYLKLLSTGSSENPIEMLAKAGVDMSNPKPIVKTIEKMNKYMDELETLIK